MPRVLTIAFMFIIYINTAIASSITIGTIDGEPEAKLSKFEALANYLQKKLSQKNINIKVEIPKDMATAIKLIKNKKLDIFIDSLYPTLKVQDKTNIQINLKRWKNNSAGYNSIIFVKKNSDINNIQDLKGKTIAFEDPFSTSSYFVPKKALERQKLVLSNEEKNKEHIKYVFSKNEMNSSAWVVFGKVDAATTDSVTFNKFDKKLYKIIYKSDFIARQLVSFSKNIKAELKKEIIDILLNMHNDLEGKIALRNFSETKKFSLIKDEELKLWEKFR